jgi:uncharacterized membrane protein YfcA
MGLPTVAMGVLGIAMPPAAAAAMLVIPSLVTNVGQLLAGPAIVTMVRRLWPMMIGIVLGTVGGSSLLVHADPMWSGVSLGTVLIIYAGYALLTPTLSIPRSVEVGAAGGGRDGSNHGRHRDPHHTRCAISASA